MVMSVILVSRPAQNVAKQLNLAKVNLPTPEKAI